MHCKLVFIYYVMHSYSSLISFDSDLTGGSEEEREEEREGVIGKVHCSLGPRLSPQNRGEERAW